MNKASRLFGSVALASGLVVGGSALTAGAAFADGGDSRNHSSYDNKDKKDDKDRDKRHNHNDGRHKHDRSVWHKHDGYGWHKHDANGWNKDKNGKSHYVVYIVHF